MREEAPPAMLAHPPLGPLMLWVGRVMGSLWGLPQRGGSPSPYHTRDRDPEGGEADLCTL